MNRREALRSITIGAAAVSGVPEWVERLVASAQVHAAGWTAAFPMMAGQAAAPVFFTPRQRETVVVLAELIIPRTETAGATDAGVASFIDTVLADAAEDEQREFLSGLAWMDARGQSSYGVDFVAARPEQQEAILTSVASPEDRAEADAAGVAFFQAMKRLTVTGYYTSEVGTREELGDPGTLFFADDPGCQHPEHKS